MTESARASELEQLLEAARKLPVCDRAAKLHALIARLVHALRNGESAADVADALASATADALADDPWFQFDAAVRAFKAGHLLAPRSLNPDLVHEGEGHGLQGIRTHLD